MERTLQPAADDIIPPCRELGRRQPKQGERGQEHGHGGHPAAEVLLQPLLLANVLL